MEPERVETPSSSAGGRSSAALRAIVSWTIAAINSRSDLPRIDPNVVIDVPTLRRVGKVVGVYSTRPFVNGAVALLELFARMLLLTIFMALSFSPQRRTIVVERMRIRLEAHVNSVRRCARARGHGRTGRGRPRTPRWPRTIF